MKKKIIRIFLKYLMKHRNEAIGGFIIDNTKYCLYVAEYGVNSTSYTKNLRELLDSNCESERWKKAFIGEDTSEYSK